MERTILCLTLIFSFTSIVHGVKSICGDDDWIAYKDEKCFKLFQSFMTRHLAEGICNQYDSSLVTIKSAAEHKFLVEYVYNKSDGNNVWIRAERRMEQEKDESSSRTEFDWSAGTPVQHFTNWAIGRPSDDLRRLCVHMQSPMSKNISEMQWVDVPCDNLYFFICEKLQAWSIERLQQIVLTIKKDLQNSVHSSTTLRDDMTKSCTKLMTTMRNDFSTQLNSCTNQMTDMRNDFTTQLNISKSILYDTRHAVKVLRNTLTAQGTQIQALQANPVPDGFVYFQLPQQREPSVIWPTLKWSEVTSQYAGLFFRAAGGSAAGFGSIQAESSPRLTWVGHKYNPSTLMVERQINADDSQTYVSSGGTWTGHNTPHWTLGFKVSKSEVRPRNQAIRIWRRIK